jgi:uncharacterized membrane protein
MSDWYTIILFLHILAGATWVGAGIALQGHAESVLRKEGHIAADRMLHEFGWATNWIFIPAPILAVATGIAMVVDNPGIGFGDLWVIIALSLFILALVLAGGIGGSYEKKLQAHRDAGTVDSPEYGRLFRAFLRVNAIEMVAVVVILSMMVFRPL